MAQVVVYYDPKNVITSLRGADKSYVGAALPVPDNLGHIDIYRVAQKLAELLLEQLTRPQ